MKRLTETSKWQDAWFRQLPPNLKLFWLYVIDNCDNAGVWNVDLGLAEFCIGTSIPLADAQKHLAGKYQPISETRWWIPKFVYFQCGTLREEAPPHKSIINLLKSYGIYTLYLDWLKSSHTHKDKTGKEKDSEGKGCGERECPESVFRGIQFPSDLDVPVLRETFFRWVECRMEGKKPKRGWVKHFQGQCDWLVQYGLAGAKQSLELSTINNWEGLHPPKGGGKSTAPSFEAIKLLKNKIQLHPANRDSTSFTGQYTPEQAQEFANLQQQLETFSLNGNHR